VCPSLGSASISQPVARHLKATGSRVIDAFCTGKEMCDKVVDRNPAHIEYERIEKVRHNDREWCSPF
jgi:hypothetical protein